MADHMERCDRCDTPTPIDDLQDVKRRYLCPDCAREVRRRAQERKAAKK